MYMYTMYMYNTNKAVLIDQKHDRNTTIFMEKWLCLCLVFSAPETTHIQPCATSKLPRNQTWLHCCTGSLRITRDLLYLYRYIHVCMWVKCVILGPTPVYCEGCRLNTTPFWMHHLAMPLPGMDRYIHPVYTLLYCTVMWKLYDQYENTF